MSTARQQEVQTRTRPVLEIVVCALIAALAGWAYFSIARQMDGFLIERNPSGYYGHLTAGLRSGHLYTDFVPPSGLLALKNPYDPVANAPFRMHDITLYQGHYYLYFGVTPALILFWPMAAATGWYPTEPCAVALFCTLAASIGIGLLFSIRRSLYPAAPAWALYAGCVVLAFANPMILLTSRPQFYQVPISCAVFLQAAMLAALWMAQRTRRATLAWLAASGLLFGLSIGARPNHLLGFAAPVVTAFFLAWRVPAGGSGIPGRTRNARLRTLGAALLASVVPAAICGAALLAYNWMRFGSVAEFGMRYQLGGESFYALRAVQPAGIPRHVTEYLFRPGYWASYFPFFNAPTSQPYGLLRYVVWGWLAVVAVIPLVGGPADRRRDRLAVAMTVMAATVANLLLLSGFFSTTERYPADFAAAWLLLAGIGGLVLAERLVSARGGAVAAVAMVAAAALSVAFTFAVLARRLPERGWLLRIERIANWPVYAVQKARGIGSGALRLELELPAGRMDVAQPIFETGVERDRRDWLQLDTPMPGRARLSFFHAGWGWLRGSDFAIPANRRVVVEARCGSLLPPIGSPIWEGWSESDYAAAHRDLEVKVDGVEVIHAVLNPYESSPEYLVLGALSWNSGGVADRFSGRILGTERLPFADARAPRQTLSGEGAVELTLRLPALHYAGSEPLLVTGRGAASDLLGCRYDGAGRLGFFLDHFGFSGPRSGWFAYDPLELHTVAIWMGSLGRVPASAPASPAMAWSRRLVVVFDGRVAMNTEQVFHDGAGEPPAVGFNSWGATTALSEFTGQIAGIRRIGLDGLPGFQRDGGYGAVALNVLLPPFAADAREPLVVTGVETAGDFVYIHYVDSQHVEFGFDHWGVRGIKGPLIQVDYSRPHRIEVAMDSLFPAGRGSRRVRVTIDGVEALYGESECYPSAPGQVRIASNPIGGSTCGPVFTGQVVSTGRTGEGAP